MILWICIAGAGIIGAFIARSSDKGDKLWNGGGSFVAISAAVFAVLCLCAMGVVDYHTEKYASLKPFKDGEYIKLGAMQGQTYYRFNTRLGENVIGQELNDSNEVTTGINVYRSLKHPYMEKRCPITKKVMFPLDLAVGGCDVNFYVPPTEPLFMAPPLSE